MDDRITFACAACGSKQFHIPTDAKPDDMVTCAGCGAASRYDEIQKAALEKSAQAVTDAFRNAFKDIKGFTIK